MTQFVRHTLRYPEVTIISTYTIHFFAGLAEHTGTRTVNMDHVEPLDVSTIKRLLTEQFPSLAAQIDAALVAVNQAYAADAKKVLPTDEIALIPPVGGGAPEEQHFFRISQEPLDPAEALSLLENVYCGGTVLFSGTVREFTGNQQTLRLSYEAYESMAIEQMKRIAEDVERDHKGVRTLQWHRIGDLYPTDVAVVCAAASPHRNDAFLAARTLIERLKKEVPIWKKEYFASGDTVWQENER